MSVCVCTCVCVGTEESCAIGYDSMFLDQGRIVTYRLSDESSLREMEESQAADRQILVSFQQWLSQ